MSRKEKIATTVLEIVPVVPVAAVPETLAALPTDLASDDPVLGPAHTAGEFATCTDTKGLFVTPILSFDVLYDTLHENGTADHFRGIANGRAYFDEQKYATRLRHSNERASQDHVDGTMPRVVSVRKAKHVDITSAAVAEKLGQLAIMVMSYKDTMMRVPRELVDMLDLTAEDFGDYGAAYKVSAVTDAQDTLRAFGRQVNREAGERTAPTADSACSQGEADRIAQALAGELRAAHDMCTCDAAEITVNDVTVVKGELAESWDAYKAVTSVKKANLVDLSF
jgi:hypothetical protein